MFRTPMAPSRLNPLILSGTISHTADEVCSTSTDSCFCLEFHIVYMLHVVFMLLRLLLLPPLGVRVLLAVPGEALPHGAAAGRQAESLVSRRRARTVSSGHFCITALGRNNTASATLRTTIWRLEI